MIGFIFKKYMRASQNSYLLLEPFFRNLKSSCPHRNEETRTIYHKILFNVHQCVVPKMNDDIHQNKTIYM